MDSSQSISTYSQQIYQLPSSFPTFLPPTPTISPTSSISRSQLPIYTSIPPQSYYNTYYYSKYNSDQRSLSQTSDNNITKNIPDMKDFLEELDQKFGENKFTCYLSVFEEQEIRVSQLAKLSDAEYISIGITIIGHRQTLHDEVRK